jgi:hypothetical protein
MILLLFLNKFLILVYIYRIQILLIGQLLESNFFIFCFLAISTVIVNTTVYIGPYSRSRIDIANNIFVNVTYILYMCFEKKKYELKILQVHSHFFPFTSSPFKATCLQMSQNISIKSNLRKNVLKF